MLDYNILKIKPIISLPCNYDEESKSTGTVRCLDLLAAPVNSDAKMSYQNDVIIVNEYYVARPDLISLAVYGDDKYADIICKFNGISNPFEINEDMVIQLPNAIDIQNVISESHEGPCELIKPDSSIKKNKTNLIKKRDAARSPSQATYGDKNYIIDKANGLVIY